MLGVVMLAVYCHTKYSKKQKNQFNKHFVVFHVSKYDRLLILTLIQFGFNSCRSILNWYSRIL